MYVATKVTTPPHPPPPPPPHTHSHTHTGLQEIHDWLVDPANSQEVVMVHINDESHSADWGHIGLIQDPVHQIFTGLQFTPGDKESLFPGRW